MIFENQYKNDYTISYRLIHMILGAIICYCNYKVNINKEKYKKYFFKKILLLLGITVYQGLQLVLNIRIYFIDQSIKNGINYKHFINKIADIWLYNNVSIIKNI